MDKFSQEELSTIIDYSLLNGKRDDFGQLHGEGYQGDRNDNCIYSGTFTHGVLDGFCSIYTRKSSGLIEIVFTGMIIEGHRFGKGMQIYNTQNADAEIVYEGDYVNDESTGEGTLRYRNGRMIYEGEFQKGYFHGYGTFYTKDGHKYEGTFINNLCVGECILSNVKTGKVLYMGEVVNYMANGKGVYSPDDNSKYVGDMVNFKRNGHGEQYLLNKHGKEVLIYKGEWKDNDYYGYGSLYNLDEELVYEGIFDENSIMSNQSLIMDREIFVPESSFMKPPKLEL